MTACIALSRFQYNRLDSSIPSVIRVRAGQKESFQLGVPARAQITGVSRQGESIIPENALEIDLSKTVTMLTEADSSYQMQVKLFGILPFKQVGIRVIEDQQLIPVGVPIGIYVKTEGVMVIGTGEFRSVNGEKVAPAEHI